MLKVDNINVSIGAVDILREVSIDLGTGAMVGLVGRNGAGKTTLLKSIMGLLKPKSGRIDFDGTDLIATPVNHRNRLGIGYMPEDRRLIPDLTVEENILVPAWANQEIPAQQRLEYVYNIIPELKEFAPRRGLQLSGGQQKLVALGRSLMVGKRLLLLDEPFEGVAPALAQRLAEVISQLKSEGMSVIFSESDLQHSKHLVHKIFLIDRGNVQEQTI
ncbi:MAG: ATP-binding cassette domain-containing protein [Burkholderiaceae bacterium]|nr:ATP-binding cassette domain-containing protein [Burkholderiaceae bacterium]MCD8564532.1 ATP-binding cassette domain-containing protein [Burkholderiaceae bacterium]